MIKKTLYFGNPAYLSLKDKQIVIHLPSSKNPVSPMNKETLISRPIEDVGIIVLDNRQITITHGLLSELLDNQVAIITCDKLGMPTGLMLPLNGNSVQNERFKKQINASLPLKKQLWQQTVQAKITNQAAVLNK